MYIEFLSPHWAFLLMNWHSAGIQETPLQEGEILGRDFKDIKRQLRCKSTKPTCIFNKAFPDLLLKYIPVLNPVPSSVY